MNSNRVYDSIVVGGGPGGLTCALFLARCRRRVLVIDSGQPRNATSYGIHGILGQDGIVPGDLIERGRAEAIRTGAEFQEGIVTNIERGNGIFHVSTEPQTYQSRTVVLAYGLRDIFPDIADFETYYGRSIHHCPYCDGYERSDQKIGVIGWGLKAIAETLLLRQWTERITLLTNGQTPEFSPDYRAKLADLSIPIKTEKIQRLSGQDGQLESLTLDSGEVIELSALFIAIGMERSAPFAEQLGCELDPVEPHIKVNHGKETNVEDVYVIGDLAPEGQLVVTAMADGAIAAIAINKSLFPPELRLTT